MQTSIVVLGIVALYIILEAVRELHTFRKVYYTVSARELNGMKRSRKVVFLSDLHNASYGKENQRLYQAIREEKPDIILIGGDMLVGKRSSSYEGTLSFLIRLAELCSVYYTNGNHEQKMKENARFYEGRYDRYRSALEANGVCVLENRQEAFLWDEAKICLTGLEIPLWGYKKQGGKPVTKRDLDRLMKKKEDGFEIVLAHNPKYMKVYEKWGGNLFLSGHYHGGIVGFPGNRGILSPDFRLFPPYTAGKHKLSKKATAIISRGLGVHTLPFRLWNPAELVIITLQGEKGNGNSCKTAGI